MSTFIVAKAIPGSLAKPPLTNSIKAGCVELLPGSEMPEHMTGVGEEALVVLAGRVTITVEGEQKTAATGEVAFIPSHSKHSVKNEAQSPARYVYVAALR